jgi:uncharacterized membrane protein YbhN (UPF0104 family)
MKADDLHRRNLARGLAQCALLVAVLVGLLVAIPGLADLRQRFGHAGAGWIVLAVAAEVASVLSYVVVFRGVFCRRLGWKLALQVGLAEQAANSLLPAGGAGGLALGAWALRRGGMPKGHIARRTVTFFVVTSAANFVAVIVVGVALGVGLLGGQDAVALTFTPAAIAAAAVLLVVALPRLIVLVQPRRAALDQPGRIGRLERAFGRGLTALASGICDAVGLVRRGDPAVIAGALGNMAFDIAALAAAFRAFGDVPAFGPLVLAYLIGQLGGLIPLPGGIAGTGGGLIGAYILYGVPAASAAAAVLTYRVVQLSVPAILGIPAFAVLRRKLRSEPSPPRMFVPLADTPVTES